MVRSAGRLAAAALLVGVMLVACGGPRRPIPAPPPPAPAPPPPPPPAPEEGLTGQMAWTREPGVFLRGETSGVRIPYAFMRLEVLRVDSAGVFVRCRFCPGEPTGYVDTAKVVHRVRSPAEAAQMELPDFVLALREAAIRRDYEALRAVMPRDFIHSFQAGEGTLEAVAAWRAHRFNDLARFPFLLDRGVVIVPGSNVWAAPPEYAMLAGYNDLRAGFRRGPNGWEWLFLVRPGI